MMVKDILKGAKKGNRTDHWMDKGSEPEPTPGAVPSPEMDSWIRQHMIREQDEMLRRKAIEDQMIRREWQERMAPPPMKPWMEDNSGWGKWEITNGSTAI